MNELQIGEMVQLRTGDRKHKFSHTRCSIHTIETTAEKSNSKILCKLHAYEGENKSRQMLIRLLRLWPSVKPNAAATGSEENLNGGYEGFPSESAFATDQRLTSGLYRIYVLG